mgnify:CR=1 FL=1
MSRQVYKNRSPWEDRWSQPSLSQLLEPIREPYRKPFEQLIEEIESCQDLRQELTWYGDAWKWTLHYTQHDGTGREVGTLCYLVPKAESPLVCVPLTGEQIEQLPLKRLGKVVREGIRAAKCAVETHWATWSPSNSSDVSQIVDLIKRKHKLVLGLVEAVENN